MRSKNANEPRHPLRCRRISGRLPHQCAHWFAMTRVFCEAKMQTSLVTASEQALYHLFCPVRAEQTHNAAPPFPGQTHFVGLPFGFIFYANSISLAPAQAPDLLSFQVKNALSPSRHPCNRKNKVDIPLKNGYNTLAVVLLWLSR